MAQKKNPDSHNALCPPFKELQLTVGTLFISFLQSPLNNNKGKSIFPFRLQKAPLIVYNSYVMEEVRGRGFSTDMGNKEPMTGTDKSITNSVTRGLRRFQLFKSFIIFIISWQLVRGARPLQRTRATLIPVSFPTLSGRTGGSSPVRSWPHV